MQNSKYTKQLQMFEDKRFKKCVKVKKPKFQIAHEEESPAEDIFRVMGDAEVAAPPPEQPQDWKSYYAVRLRELRREQPCLSHNEITQKISEEWKSRKSAKKRKFDVQQPKCEPERCSEESEHLDFNNFESAEFIERLRASRLKFVINDQTFEVLGKTIIDAISANQTTIYLNEFQCSSKTETPNQKFSKSIQQEQCIESDSDQSIYKSESLVIENKLSSIL